MYIPLFLASKVHTFPSTLTQGFAREPEIDLDITSFITGASRPDRIVDEMVARVIDDIKSEFPDVRYSEWGTLMDVLLDVATQKGRRVHDRNSADKELWYPVGSEQFPDVFDDNPEPIEAYFGFSDTQSHICDDCAYDKGLQGVLGSNGVVRVCA